jgi:uncharacterized protein YerC
LEADNQERHRSENGEARRNIERTTAEGKNVFDSPNSHTLASFEARLGLETVVPLLEQAQTFAAPHAAASASSSTASRHRKSRGYGRRSKTTRASISDVRRARAFG